MFLSNVHLRLLKRFIFLLLPYSLLRIGFYFYHLNTYKQFTQDEIFTSFLQGIRFDVAAICMVNIPVILLSLIPSNNSKFLKFERSQFVAFNLVGFIISLNDYELFMFMGKRLSADLFSVGGDIIDQLPQMAVYYWYFPVAGILLAILLSYLDKTLFKLKKEKLRPLLHVLSSVFILGLSFVGIRGGLQHKSINVQSAFVQGKNELGHLVLNTPYHFIRTLKNRSISKINFFGNDDEAKKIIISSKSFKSSFAQPKKYNFVVLILESFSLEYVEKGYAPFLSSLIEDSLYFDKHLANGRRSIEVLPSVFCGLPSVIDDPISKSSFSGNKFNCLPEYLKKNGYTNYFFHGGSRGTMGFESYTLSIGFDRYFSKEDYGNKDYDGTWGIFDGPFLKFTGNKISEMKSPFMAGIFTLSSHQPYSVPENLKSKFEKGSLEIHQSIGYTDFAVKEFFEQVKKEEWFKDTIFIITADHTQKLETKKFSNMVGHYRVPLLIYAPDLELEKKDKVTQHADIPHTVLDMIGESSDEMPLVGSSVFSNEDGSALNYADGSTYFLATMNTVQTVNKSGEGQNFIIDWESGLLTPTNGDNKLVKANVQYFINGLINNNLSL